MLRTTRRSVSPLFTAVLLLAASTGCRSPAERAAQAIVEKSTEARGGLKAWRAVSALSMSGSLEAGVPRDPLKLAQSYLKTRTETKADLRRAALHGQAEAPKQLQLPFTMELKRPRLSRVEVKFQGETAVQVYDGAHGWKLRPFLGRHEVEPYTEQELELAAQQSDLDGPLIDADAKGNKVELVGTEKVEGRDAYALTVTSAKGQVRHVWVDTQTFLEVQVDGTRRLDGKPHRVLTALRDYRPVGGVLVPHTLETTVEGVPGSERILVEHVSLNPELADARFSQPR